MASPSSTPSSSQDVVGLIRQYILPVGSNNGLNSGPTTTASLPNRPTSTSESSPLPRRPVPTTTPGLPNRSTSTTPATSSQDVVGLIRQYVLPVGSNSQTTTTSTPSVPTRPVRTVTNTVAQRILDAINSGNTNSNSSSPVTPPTTTPTIPSVPTTLASDIICKDVALVNNPGVNLGASACTSATRAGALPKITIVNNLGRCLDSASNAVLYENYVIQVNKSGIDLMYASNRYCNPELAYPPVIERSASKSFSVSEALVRTSSYYINISLGRWDQAYDLEMGDGDWPTPVPVFGCWDRNSEEILNMAGELVSKTRRIKIDHPKNKDVTLYLFRFFPSCSYSDSTWESSLNSGLRGVGAI